MQAMAQMGYQGYQEQIPVPALLPVKEEYTNCTPHRPKARFHMIWEDFILIGDNDDANGNALRAFEWLTNQLIDDLRKEHGVPKSCLPSVEDLWLEDVSTRRLAEITLHVREKSTYARCLQDPLDRDEDEVDMDEDEEPGPRSPRSLIELGFIERRFVARPRYEDMERPATTFYEDKRGRFIIVDNATGDYTDGDEKPHNAMSEGYIVKRQYRYCIEAVNTAIAALDWHDPPEPAKRWPPIVKRRDPVPQQKGNDAAAPTDCDPRSASDASENQPISYQTSDQGGTSNAEDCKESGYFHDTVDTKVMSTIHTDIGMNVLEGSANSQESSDDSKDAEDFSEAPWSTETLIGLAKARHTQGLFEIHDEDADYDGAESLDRRRLSLGLSPTQFWPLVDQHIAAMMDANSGTWWATKRRGKNLRFGLVHVDAQWNTVEETLVKKPWSPLNSVPYLGPPLDHEEGYASGYGVQLDSPPIDEPPVIIEGSLEMPGVPIEEYDVQGDDDPPGETEDTMHILPPPTQVWPPTRRGMNEAEFDALCLEIWQCHPSLALEKRTLSDGSLAVNLECRPRQWVPVRNAVEWQQRKRSNLGRAVEDAVRYAESRREP